MSASHGLAEPLARSASRSTRVGKQSSGIQLAPLDEDRARR